MDDAGGVDAWRALCREVAEATNFPFVQEATARRLKRWFDSVATREGWESAAVTFRNEGGADSRLLGIRTWWPLERPAGRSVNEWNDSNLQLQLVVGPRVWSVQQVEAEALRRRSPEVRKEGTAIFVLQGAGDTLPITPGQSDDQAVWIYLAWRLPPVAQRVGAADLAEIERRLGSCFGEVPVVRLNGDCQHAMASILMIAPTFLRLPGADVAGFVEEVEGALRDKLSLLGTLWADPGRRQALVSCAADAKRAAAVGKQPKAAELPEEDAPLGGTAARLCQMLTTGAEREGWPKNIILYGPPGTGKTYIARQAIRKLLGEHDVGNAHARSERFGMVVFHPAYEYDQFIGGIRVGTSDAGHVTYVTEPGVFTRLAERARKSSETHVLLIDEINRGNLPKILGELLFALEYRDQAVDVSFRREPLVVPSNLLVVATMNTSDRSVGSLDAAVRRRFAFLACDPDPEIVDDLQQRAVLVTLNKALREHSELEGLALGHSYLLDKSPEQAASRWKHQVVPLLEEYARYAGKPVVELLPAEYRQGQVWQDLLRLIEIERCRQPSGDSAKA